MSHPNICLSLSSLELAFLNSFRKPCARCQMLENSPTGSTAWGEKSSDRDGENQLVNKFAGLHVPSKMFERKLVKKRGLM